MASTIDDTKADHYRQIDARIAPTIDPSSTVDVACFMTTDTVDADNEIVLPSGVDLSRFEKNPILLLAHGYGQPGSYYPLTIGKVVGTRRRPNGILAQIKFAESSAMGREVKGLFEEEMLRSFSIGFRSLESSRLTREEANSRPDWQAAYEKTGGKILVHRKSLLLELSVTPLPANPDALVAAYKSRGTPLPSWLQEEMKMSTATDAAVEPGGDEEVVETADDIEAKAACACGKADCPKCGTHEKVADEESDPDETEPDDDSDDNGESEEGAGFRRGDHVKIKAPHYKGFGEVQGVHRKGHVPHVAEDIKGTKDEPAARVKCYKAMGDGYVPTTDHIGAKCAHMTKMAQRMEMPSKKFAPPPERKTAKAAPSHNPLPPLVALTDEEIQQQAVQALSKLPQLVSQEIARYMGVV